VKKSELRKLIKEEIISLNEEIEGYQQAADRFIEFANEQFIKQYKEQYPRIYSDGYYDQLAVLKPGKKYDKVVVVHADDPKKATSAYCFIERETGLVYKAATWSAPAKGPRASVFKPETYRNVDLHGGWLYRR